MEDNLIFLKTRMKTSRKWKKPKKNKHRRQPKKNKKNGRRPQKKWKTNQSTKINLIGCDTIVNSPSSLSIAAGSFSWNGAELGKKTSKKFRFWVGLTVF